MYHFAISLCSVMHLQYINAAICIISNLIVLGFVFELLDNIAH